MQKVIQQNIKLLMQFFKIAFINKYFILIKKTSLFLLLAIFSLQNLYISKRSYFVAEILVNYFVYWIDIPLRVFLKEYEIYLQKH